jgi:hypothetical protein
MVIKKHVLKLLKNLYGQRHAGRAWNKHLTSVLLGVSFVQSKVDECVFYRGDLLFMVYFYDGIFLLSHHECNQSINSGATGSSV